MDSVQSLMAKIILKQTHETATASLPQVVVTPTAASAEPGKEILGISMTDLVT